MFLTLALISQLALAQFQPVHAPKDKPYRLLVHPETDTTAGPQAYPARSEVHRMISVQSPVKAQLNRGTCSIFSATALMEAMVVIKGKMQFGVDLSEEWLQYLTTLRVSEEGSTSPANFKLLRQFGQPSERRMPYNGTEWKSKRDGLAMKRCGHLPRGDDLKACLISHRDPNLMRMSDQQLLNPVFHLYDPEFVTARTEAAAHRNLFFDADTGGEGIVRKVSEIHELLAKGIPLALDLNFYNGAWNYPGMARKGIYRSEKLWREGVVTHAEQGSVDLEYSKAHPEGHSVVVVGYDDEREVEYWVSMTDGTRKKFKRKGVYYFKNSWGPTWAKDFAIDGVKYPGYGMILQVHAHAQGQFYRLKIN